jgi:hypothetical protein
VIGLGVSTVTVWTPFPAHRADAKSAGESAAWGAGQVGPEAGPRTGMGASEGPADPAVSRFAASAEDALGGRLTDEMLNRALTDDALISKLVEDVVAGAREARPQTARKSIPNVTALIPAGHGMAAIATMLLAVLTAVGAR